MAFFRNTSLMIRLFFCTADYTVTVTFRESSVLYLVLGAFTLPQTKFENTSLSHFNFYGDVHVTARHWHATFAVLNYPNLKLKSVMNIKVITAFLHLNWPFCKFHVISLRSWRAWRTSSSSSKLSKREKFYSTFLLVFRNFLLTLLLTQYS